jgi:hypothetical protein
MSKEFKRRRGEDRLVLWLEDTLFGLEITVSRCATRRRKADERALTEGQTAMLEKFRELDRRFGFSDGLTEGALLALGKVFRLVRAPDRLLLFRKSEKSS